MDRATAIPLFVSGLVFVDLRDDTLSIVELDEIGDGSAMSKARNCRSIEDRLGEVAHLGHPFVTFHVVGYPHKPMCHCQKYGGEKLFTERCQHDEVMLNSIVRSINRTDVSFRRDSEKLQHRAACAAGELRAPVSRLVISGGFKLTIGRLLSAHEF